MTARTRGGSSHATTAIGGSTRCQPIDDDEARGWVTRDAQPESAVFSHREVKQQEDGPERSRKGFLGLVS